MAKRRPSPEQQTSDRSVINAFAHAVAAIAKRYPDRAELFMAGRLLGEFAASKVDVPAKRKAAVKMRDAIDAERERQEAIAVAGQRFVSQ